MLLFNLRHYWGIEYLGLEWGRATNCTFLNDTQFKKESIDYLITLHNAKHTHNLLGITRPPAGIPLIKHSDMQNDKCDSLQS